MKWLSLVMLLTTVLSLASAANADDRNDDRDNDHDVARELYEHGEIEALHNVLRALRKEVQGDIIGVQLVQSAGKWIYRFQVIAPDGRRYSVDAKAAAVRPVRDEDDD